MTPTPASMPPMPTPVTARRAPSWTPLRASAEASMPPLISSRHNRMIGWRPKRSPHGARKSEPAAMPNRPALNRKPSSAPLNFHSAEMGAAVKAMTSTSKPSSIINITQTATAAVSMALRKMRAEFNDQLFIRTARGMVPTPQAERIVEKARPLLEQLQSKALLQERFDPATARQAFCFALSDVGEMVFLPSLLANLHREAPLASVRSVSMSPAETASGLERGTVDLAIGFYPDLKQSHFFQQRLFTHHFV